MAHERREDKADGAENQKRDVGGLAGAGDGEELGQVAGPGEGERLARAAEHGGKERRHQPREANVVHEHR